MKSLVLNGSEIKILTKVDNSGHGFYSSVLDFLQENKDLVEDGETVVMEISNDVEFEDITRMIEDYLDDDGLSDEDLPNPSERVELKRLLKRMED